MSRFDEPGELPPWLTDEPEDEEDGCSICGCVNHSCDTESGYCDCCPECRYDQGFPTAEDIADMDRLSNGL